LVPVKEEEELNNNQIEETNGNDLDWFWGTRKIL
jgi:hypothetical protein